MSVDTDRGDQAPQPAPAPAADRCQRCIYGEPVDHTCDPIQEHRWRVEHRGRL